jgi:1-deoxy-D-xylulose-5-phosphate synthase
VTFAAGMACEGMKPVVAIYSTFLQRGYDQLIHDVALQNLDVTFALDRAGWSAPTARPMPATTTWPSCAAFPTWWCWPRSDENECRQMLSTAYHYPGPAAVRYPRGAGIGAAVGHRLDTIPLGKGELRETQRQGRRHPGLRHDGGAEHEGRPKN